MTPRVQIEIVVPVYNEEDQLERSVRTLHDHLTLTMPFPWGIVIADNASTDATWAIAERLSCVLEGVSALRLEQKGRGRALRAAWLASRADVVAYMDVDLSTDLRALLPLVAPLITGHSDVAIGTRLARQAHVTRGVKREFISRAYNHLLRTVLRARFSDAQCGFKAVRAEAARRLLPHVQDDGWFFDTELLVLAQRDGLRIHEVPVDWVDDPDSRVDIVSTAVGDLRGVGRMLAGSAPARFAAVGAASTAFYATAFMGLRALVAAGLANALALAVSGVANTQANRRFTFGLRGRAHLVRQHVAGAILFALALALTSGALAVLQAVDRRPGHLLELIVLVGASAFATVTRYVGLRTWVFARHRTAASSARAVASA